MLSVDGTSYEMQPSPISSVVDADSGMHRTWFALKDSSVKLSDGLRCSVRWGMAKGVWEAPAAAVYSSEQGSRVWRLRDGKQESVPVKVVRSSGASVLLTGELHGGDSVSADGASIAALNAQGGTQ